MIGVLLCGGRSLRMGKDKGMMPLQSSTWAEHVGLIVASVSTSMVVSVNEDQYEYYRNVFSESILVKDAAIDVNGPLKGLISVHQRYPDEDLLILACDMIDMKKEVLELLIEEHRQKHESEVSVFENEGQIEPLCGIYSFGALHKLDELLKNGKLSKHSMMYALEQVNTNYIDLPKRWKGAFRNYNCPEDLEK